MVRLMQGWSHQLLPSYGGKGLRWGFRDETVHSLVPHALRTGQKVLTPWEILSSLELGTAKPRETKPREVLRANIWL